MLCGTVSLSYESAHSHGDVNLCVIKIKGTKPDLANASVRELIVPVLVLHFDQGSSQSCALHMCVLLFLLKL